jgi:hypothetical protein
MDKGSLTNLGFLQISCSNVAVAQLSAQVVLLVSTEGLDAQYVRESFDDL